LFDHGSSERREIPLPAHRAPAGFLLDTCWLARATNGDHPMLGIDFWSLTDSCRGESTNWGLISNRDNAYDSKAAIDAPGTDKWGFTTGGQDRNYGNFLDEVTQTNLNTVKQFIVESH
jgi:hypothetical protein